MGNDEEPILATFFLPRLRHRYKRDALVLRGATLQAISMAALAYTNSIWIAVPALFFGGAAWITTANTLSVSIQLGLPDWVRARGMSIYQMAIMGASALGAALWGQIATWTNVPITLAIASVSGMVAMQLACRFMPDVGVHDDITPNRLFRVPSIETPPTSGHVTVMIEYIVDPARADEFRQLMLREGRRSRMRHGALSWELLHDISAPGRFVETYVDENWTEHLRRFDRLTAADAALRDRKQAYHLGELPPRVTRCLMETTVRTH